MNLLHDFFILIWGESFDEQTNQQTSKLTKTLKELNEELFCDICTILLSINEKNIEKFSNLDAYVDLEQILDMELKDNEENVKLCQNIILLQLQNYGKTWSKKVILKLQKLHKHKIILSQHFKTLTSILELIEDRKPPQKTKANPKEFKELIQLFKTSINKLLDIKDDARAKELRQKIEDKSFSVGITGVMNAGKSTFLNALLSKKILGTSVVPETANLSILHYSKTPHAKVNFWNKRQWQNMEKSAEFLPQMQKFIDQTKEHFKDDFDEYVQEKTRSISIESSNLQLYTSAQNPICNLVKSVELYEDLDFLQEGINIVDTPGLDDPVVEREEITKAYLNKCDVMFHLMNAKQSATQKDVDFIIEALSYGHISRLLILITKADTISENDLKEVISYTKQSIKKRLLDENQLEKFDLILSKLDFLPLSGYMALLHKTGQGDIALKQGYSLEQTGLPKIEKFLKEELFTKEKNQLFIQSIKSELLSIIADIEHMFSFEYDALNGSSKELRASFLSMQKEHKQELERIQNIQSKIDLAKTSLENYFLTLHKFIAQKITYLKSILIQKICDDLSYELRKNKKKPSSTRINVMIKTTIKDHIVELIREYRYEFFKRMEQEIAQINLGEKHTSSQHFNSLEYFEQTFKNGFISGGFEVCFTRVKTALKKAKKDELDAFSQELELIFKDGLENVQNAILRKLNKINQSLLTSFHEETNKPLNELRYQMSQKEKSLSKNIYILETDKEKARGIAALIKEKLTSLKALKTELKGLE